MVNHHCKMMSIFLSGICFSLPVMGICAENTSSTANVIDTRSTIERLVAVRPAISPSSSLSSPVAYGAQWGDVFFGVVGEDGTQDSTRAFGQYAVGFGLGNPDKFVSLTTTVTAGGIDDGTRDGNVNFLVSRNLSNATAIAFGVENVAPWGADKDNKMNTFGVVSSVLPFNSDGNYPMNIVTSIGVGNSRFVHNFPTNNDENDVHKVAPFANVGFQVLPQAAIIFDYVGQTVNAGVSVVPFITIPLVASVTAIDLGNKGGSRIPIAVSLGYNIKFA